MLEVVGAAGDFDDVDAEVLAELRVRLVDRVDEFWARNRGDVGFYFTDGDDAAELLLYYSSLHGYHVLHRGFDDVSDFALVRVAGSDAAVTIEIGGDPVEVPARAFAPAETMWRAVDEFVRDGGRPRAPEGYEWRRGIAADPGVRILTIEQGSPTAVDSPYGYLRMSLSTDGGLEFYRRHGAGSQNRFGSVAPERVQALIAGLERTDFPAQRQMEFPPGSSVCTVTLDPPKQHVRLHYFSALDIDGYREVLEAFTELSIALMGGDAEKLRSWKFEAKLS